MKDRDERLSNLNREIIILTDELNRSSDEIVRLGDIINSSELKYSNLVERFQAQREKIKYLTV